MMPRPVNTYDQLKAAGGDQVAICYRARGDYRSMTSPAWQVIRVKDGVILKTDLTAHWSDYGLKTFVVFGADGSTPQERRRSTLIKAMAWVARAFGPRDFVRNRLGAYVPKAVQERFPIPKREAP